MTGNVVFAGFAIVGAPGFSLSASLFALAGFLVGASAGGAMITRVGSDLAAVALVLAALSGDPGVTHGTITPNTGHIIAGAFGPAITDALAAVLATAMGIQNAVARKLAVPDLTTTVLTMTLTGIGADLRAVLRAGATHATAKSDLMRRLLAIGTMLAGALAGASLTLYVSPVSALALAVSLLALTAGAAAAVATRPAPW